MAAEVIFPFLRRLFAFFGAGRLDRPAAASATRLAPTNQEAATDLPWKAEQSRPQPSAGMPSAGMGSETRRLGSGLAWNLES
jgi:hypothetical protein